MIKLFYWDRMMALPLPLRMTIWFNIAANTMIAIEATVAMFLKVEHVAMWAIPIIGIAQQLAFLLSDTAVGLGLARLWRSVYTMQLVCLVTWLLIGSGIEVLIWVVMGCWIIDSVLWQAESTSLQVMISEQYPEHYLEYKRLNTHNKVLPGIIVAGLTSVAMAFGLYYAIALIIVGYAVQQVVLGKYISTWTGNMEKENSVIVTE